MKLIYTKTGKEVVVGDEVTRDDGEVLVVTYYREPHKSASEGKVSVCHPGGDEFSSMEYYVSIIGAEWIEREDRGWVAEENHKCKGDCKECKSNGNI